MRVSLPARCSLRNSWNTACESLKAATDGAASAALTQSQKPESSVRSGRALLFSKPAKQTTTSWRRLMDLFAANPLSLVLSLRFLNRLPLHVIGAVLTATHERFDVIDHVTRPTMWIASLSHEFVSRRSTSFDSAVRVPQSR